MLDVHGRVPRAPANIGPATCFHCGLSGVLTDVMGDVCCWLCGRRPGGAAIERLRSEWERTHPHSDPEAVALLSGLPLDLKHNGGPRLNIPGASHKKRRAMS